MPDEPTEDGPPHLQEAIQAATNALATHMLRGDTRGKLYARVAVVAAWAALTALDVSSLKQSRQIQRLENVYHLVQERDQSREEAGRLREANRKARALIEDVTLDQPCGNCMNMLGDALDALDQRPNGSEPDNWVCPSCLNEIAPGGSWISLSGDEFFHLACWDDRLPDGGGELEDR